MIRHEEELYRVLDEHGISHNDVCIVGSSVITYAGFRENNDLDITLRPASVSNDAHSAARVINLSQNIQACSGRYWAIGINDDELFTEDCSENYNGVRIARFELEVAKKLRRLELKDKHNLVEIGSAHKNIDWGKIFHLAYLNGEKATDEVRHVSKFRKAARRIKRAVRILIRGSADC